MLFDITHRTRYRYSHPVFIEPMTVRLRPRSDANQTVRDYRIIVTPIPIGISQCTDLDGNNTETMWFNGLQDNLLIEVHTLVETHQNDPFNYLITDNDDLTLPLRYPIHLAVELAHYLIHESDNPLVNSFAQELMLKANYQTISFLMLLAEQIPTRLRYTLREHGDSWNPEDTLKQGVGACRDFSVLYMEVCRIAGIAARFVSGYCIGDVASESHMHAWVEVYLPGAGWRGFDPSRGVTTSDDHVSVAASYRPQGAAPTFGSFRGEGESNLEAEIIITLPEVDNLSGTA